MERVVKKDGLLKNGKKTTAEILENNKVGFVLYYIHRKTFADNYYVIGCFVFTDLLDLHYRAFVNIKNSGTAKLFLMWVCE